MRPFLHESTQEQAQTEGVFRLSLPQDITSPVRAHLSLKKAGYKPCLLESAEGPLALAKYSFVAINPTGVFKATDQGCSLTLNGKTTESEDSAIEGLRKAQALVKAPEQQPGLPPFAGGWIGYFSYELVAALEPTVPIKKDKNSTAELAYFAFYGDVVAFDHAAQQIHVITNCGERSEEEINEARSRAVKLAVDIYGRPELPGPIALEGDITSLYSEEGYVEGVQKLQADIGQGEIFQAVLSRRFEQRFKGDAFTIYRALRLTNPAPHMFYFEAPELTLIGSSPERLVSVENRKIETRPIAGTRPRGATKEEDDALAQGLRRDPKERAEHDMLVDLARNDLGRVARIGTVRRSRYQTLERFSRVQHLVSIVEAELRTDCDALDALAACFPAGTVSGAPKVRAMQLIGELEPEARGPYAGAFGYLDRWGNLDVAITIRTLVARDGAVSVQAGAGIVHASVPESEAKEVSHKSQAMLESIELAASPVFGPPQDTPAASDKGGN